MSASRVFVAGGTGYLGRAAAPRCSPAATAWRCWCGRLRAPRAGGRRGGRRQRARPRRLRARARRHAAPARRHTAPGTVEGGEFEAVDFAAGRAAATALARGQRARRLPQRRPPGAEHARLLAVCASGSRRCSPTAGVPATFLRPWYVLGPGHRWARLLRRSTGSPSAASESRRGAAAGARDLAADGARRCSPRSVDPPASGTRVVEVPAIRAAAAASPAPLLLGGDPATSLISASRFLGVAEERQPELAARGAVHRRAAAARRRRRGSASAAWAAAMSATAGRGWSRGGPRHRPRAATASAHAAEVEEAHPRRREEERKADGVAIERGHRLEVGHPHAELPEPSPALPSPSPRVLGAGGRCVLGRHGLAPVLVVRRRALV